MTDVLDVFGKVPMQASLIERCEHRETFSLVGRAHELGYWSEGDSRMPKLENTRMYYAQVYFASSRPTPSPNPNPKPSPSPFTLA